ncbi:hypothetical protein RF11_16348 [Thelohanellus kitauei]|uniref:Tc1-like transposase DDE domain-containing protein n=1 Tax=Thelohanellus kitauei TaxID=669202 RepID=A0A0C2MPF0_THEKT|nr:hypothetical protein RF11_16348 [Thelohanellus kitauei]
MHFSLLCSSYSRKRRDEHTIIIRKPYAERYTLIEEQFAPRTIIFLDDVGFNASMRIKKGWSLVGTNSVSNDIKIHHPYKKDTFKDCIVNLMNYLEKSSVGPRVFMIDTDAFHKFDL